MVYNLLGFTQILVRSCKVGTRLRDLLSGLAIAVVIHSLDLSRLSENVNKMLIRLPFAVGPAELVPIFM